MLFTEVNFTALKNNALHYTEVIFNCSFVRELGSKGEITGIARRALDWVILSKRGGMKRVSKVWQGCSERHNPMVVEMPNLDFAYLEIHPNSRDGRLQKGKVHIAFQYNIVYCSKVCYIKLHFCAIK